MKFSFGKVALVTVIPLVGCLLLASAQESPDKKTVDPAAKKSEAPPPAASRFLDHSSPELTSPSHVSFTHDEKELRVVGISPQLKSSPNYVKGLRFHKILGALAERAMPVEEGMPNIIDGIRHNPDGSVWLQFRLIVTTPEFQKRCRDAVLSQERELLKEENLTQDDIRIEPWPLKHCVITAQDSFSKEIIGVSQTGSLIGTKGSFNFSMLFSQPELRKVLGLIRAGELEFVYTYSYVGSTEYKGSVDLRGVRDAKLVASQKLRSEQFDGKKVEGSEKLVLEPIFQGEANEAIRHLYVSVQKTMRVSHKDLIPLLDQPSLFQKLFTDDGQITFKDLKEGDEKTALMLAAYLKPHLEQVRESYGGEKSDIKIHEDKVGEGKTNGASGNLGISIPLPLPIPIGLSFGGGLSSSTTKSQEVLDRIEQATGSKWAYDKATKRFRPHFVKKLKFLSGADQVLINEKSTVFLSVGTENRYLEETPIPVTFTTKSAKVTFDATTARLGAYEGVPIGAMVPFFGAELPKGYVWADGQVNFPNADWVPEHLRGGKVPDMREQLIGGTRDMLQVGMPFNRGKLAVKGTIISGGSFKTPADEGVSIVKESYLMNTDSGGAKAFIKVRDVFKGQLPQMWDVKNQIGQTTGWETVDPASAIQAVRGGKLLTGICEIKDQDIELKFPETNPRHIMCRFIIRVK